MPELAQARDRRLSLARREVVEDGLGHEQVRRRRAVLGLDLRHPQRRVEREVDVVSDEELSAFRPVAEGREPIPAGLRRFEELAVVLEVEGAAHAAASTSTVSFVAAWSARRRASSEVSAVAMT